MRKPMTKADQRVMAAVKQARAYLRGDKTAVRETKVQVVRVKAILPKQVHTAIERG